MLTALRRCSLAVSVLDDIDLTPNDDGVLLSVPGNVLVRWTECLQAIDGADPDSDTARHRLAQWLRLRTELVARPMADLAERARPLGVPRGAVSHPGKSWVQQRVHGGALDLGIGFWGLHSSHPSDVTVVPAAALEAAGVDVRPWWPAAQAYLERMGRLAAERYVRRGQPLVRPMGNCDPVTLLGSATFRRALVAERHGLRGIAAPTRSSAWLDPSATDPEFVAVLADAAPAGERGFDRPVLFTAEEVSTVRTAADVAADAARAGAPELHPSPRTASRIGEGATGTAAPYIDLTDRVIVLPDVPGADRPAADARRPRWLRR